MIAVGMLSKQQDFGGMVEISLETSKRSDCRLERVHLRHKEVRKNVTEQNIVINTSRLIVIVQQFSNGRPALTCINTLA